MQGEKNNNIALQAMRFDFPNDVFEAHRVQRAQQSAEMMTRHTAEAVTF